MGKKLRVGFVSVDDASSEKTWSGTPLNILSRLQSRSDVEVELVSPLKTNLKWLYLPYKLQEKITKKSFVWYVQPGSLRYFAKQIEAAVREKKLDVVFSTSSIPGTFLDPSIPSVFWTDAVWHGMEGYYPGLFSNLSKAMSKAGRAQEEASLRRAQYSCYSSAWAAKVAATLTDPDRVKVLPYGPNLSYRSTRSDVETWVHSRQSLHPGHCTLLFTGKDWDRKGGHLAVETARLLNDRGIKTTLRVVGCRPTGPLPPFVDTVGFIDKTTAEGKQAFAQVYQTADIFILPTQAEASAIVLPEAAAWGLPILTCDTGGLGDYVINDINGFRLPVTDTGLAFAQKAELILNNYSRFAFASFDEYQSRLNWETSVDRLVELLHQAVTKV